MFPRLIALFVLAAGAAASQVASGSAKEVKCTQRTTYKSPQLVSVKLPGGGVPLGFPSGGAKDGNGSAYLQESAASPTDVMELVRYGDIGILEVELIGPAMNRACTSARALTWATFLTPTVPCASQTGELTCSLFLNSD